MGLYLLPKELTELEEALSILQFNYPPKIAILALVLIMTPVFLIRIYEHKFEEKSLLIFFQYILLINSIIFFDILQIIISIFIITGLILSPSIEDFLTKKV